MTISYIYTDTGTEIPVEALSVGKVFFRRRNGPYAISRRDLEKKGKAYDRVAKTWMYLDQGKALAAAARARQKQIDEETAAAAARAQRKAATYEAPPSDAGPQKREADGRLLRLKQAMADAHPDRGGTSEAFIAARKRYLKAKADLAAV
jgi:hypothetical protein